MYSIIGQKWHIYPNTVVSFYSHELQIRRLAPIRQYFLLHVLLENPDKEASIEA